MPNHAIISNNELMRIIPNKNITYSPKNKNFTIRFFSTIDNFIQKPILLHC